MKRLTVIIALFLAFGLLSFGVAADDSTVSVNIDGKTIDCASYGQQATIVEGRTLVPLRAIFEALGANVVWDSTARTVISCRNGVVIELETGSNTLVKNGRNIALDVPAAIMNDRTMVPLRAVAEAFDVAVEWDADSRIAFLTTTDGFEKNYPNSFSSSLYGKKAYGEFMYGMTMQQCWDAIDESEGEKQVAALEDGFSEIRISADKGKYTNEDAEITGEYDILLTRLVFAGDYLYSLQVVSESLDTPEKAFAALDGIKNYCGDDCAEEKNGLDSIYVWNDKEQEVRCVLSGVNGNMSESKGEFTLGFTDKNVKVYLYGYDVPSQARLDSYYFLMHLSQFDLSSASAYCTAENSVKLLNIRRAEDMLTYVGFDKQARIDEMVENTFGGDENYRPVAREMAQAIEKIILQALSEADVETGEFYGISEARASLDFSITIPDIRFVLEKGMQDFAADLESVISENITEPGALDGRRQLLAIAPVIGSLLSDSCKKYFDICPTFVITPEKPLELVLDDGEWRVDADGEYVKKILNGFKLFW